MVRPGLDGKVETQKVLRLDVRHAHEGRRAGRPCRPRPWFVVQRSDEGFPALGGGEQVDGRREGDEVERIAGEAAGAMALRARSNLAELIAQVAHASEQLALLTGSCSSSARRSSTSSSST